MLEIFNMSNDLRGATVGSSLVMWFTTRASCALPPLLAFDEDSAAEKTRS